MTNLEILLAARELLSNPARWTQRSFARDEGDEAVSAVADEAVCWCAIGALRRSAFPNSIKGDSYLYWAAQELFGKTHIAVNDDLGHEAVMQMYDKAIELAHASEP